MPRGRSKTSPNHVLFYLAANKCEMTKTPRAASDIRYEDKCAGNFGTLYTGAKIVGWVGGLSHFYRLEAGARHCKPKTYDKI